MKKTIAIVAAIVVVLGYVGASIKKMIDDQAKYEQLQNRLAVLGQRVDQQNQDNARIMAMVRQDSLLIDSLRTQRVEDQERMRLLLADSAKMGHKLTEARAARYQADSMLAALRHATDETLLTPEGYRLVMAERAAGDKARQQADDCDDALANCEERVGNLQGQIGTFEVETQTLQKDLDSAKVELLDWQSLSSSQDSTIEDLNRRLKPSFWQILSRKEFLYGAAGGATLTVILIEAIRAMSGG